MINYCSLFLRFYYVAASLDSSNDFSGPNRLKEDLGVGLSKIAHRGPDGEGYGLIAKAVLVWATSAWQLSG